jgi:hypothetical protein
MNLKITSNFGGVAERLCVRLQIALAVSEFIGVRIPSPPFDQIMMIMPYEVLVEIKF